MTHPDLVIGCDLFVFCFLGEPDARLHLMNLHNAFLGKTTMDGNRDTQKTDSFYL